MVYRVIFLICCISLQVCAKASKIANYTIDVALQPATKTLKASQTLVWTNTSTKAINDLQFHMYLNAFKDMNSTFMRGSGGKLRTDQADITKSINFGSIKITKAILNNGLNLMPNMRFIQPDDGNTRDQTVLEILLPRAVNPGETISVVMEFESKLPKIFARTGWASNDYFFIGQWFPKIGVLEKDGKWNCHQFHANTEFYADFGTYNVNITVPQSFTVAATGSKISETKLKSGLKTMHFEAENVHDFAWTASPHFVAYSENYKGLELKAFMQPEHKNMADRYFESVKNAIDFMEKHVGKYPHKTLSMIDPSYEGSGSGGMEYPTLITCGASWGLGRWAKYQEIVTIHEFVHQYFQGILASNEFENSWLDEGFTQYLEGRIMDTYYPKGSVFNFLGFSVNDAATSRQDYVTMQNPSIAAIRTDAWRYPGGTYSTLTYTKPATVLRTMQNLIGTDTMDEILKTYYQRFKFRHPTPQDFFDTANEIVAKGNKYPDLDWFFKQTILEAKVCDYTVKNLRNAKGKGSFELRNLKDMEIPVNVLVTYMDTTTEIIKWRGKSQNFSRNKEIYAVQIDPENKNWLDLNLINNSVAVQPQQTWALKYAAKIMFWIQNSLFLG